MFEQVSIESKRGCSQFFVRGWGTQLLKHVNGESECMLRSLDFMWQTFANHYKFLSQRVPKTNSGNILLKYVFNKIHGNRFVKRGLKYYLPPYFCWWVRWSPWFFCLVGWFLFCSFFKFSFTFAVILHIWVRPCQASTLPCTYLQLKCPVGIIIY